jgi:putative transcriptional regulator
VERLAPVIRDLRNRLGLTQEEFAHALGITVSTVNRWEKGHSAPSKLARASLARFAGRRGVAVESLLEEADQGMPSMPPVRSSTN